MTDTERMMSEEYGREFGGCLWVLVACAIVAIVTTLAIVL